MKMEIIQIFLVFTFLAPLQALPSKYKLNEIQSSSGIFYHNLGKAHVSTNKFTILTYHNLTNIKNHVKQISSIYMNSISICQMSIKDHLASYCKNQLSYVNTKMNLINKLYQTISHQFNNQRRKRGIFDGVGTAIKWLIGTPDANDAQFYSDSINGLINNNKQTEVLMLQQITILSSTISNFNSSFRKMNENIEVLNHNLKAFHIYSKQMKNMKESLEIQNRITNHSLLLIEMTDEVLNTLENYINDVILLQHGIISYRIMFPEQLLHELITISSKFTLPISPTIENIYLYYKFMGINSFIKDNILIIALEIPLASFEILDMYHLLSLPTPHEDDHSLFSYIEPTKPYLLISHMRTSYLMVDNLDNCEEYRPKEWICKKMPTLKKSDNTCEIQLLSNIIKSIPKSCKTRNLIADAEIWHEIDVNQWLYSLSASTKLTIICDEDPLRNEIIKKMGILELNPNCKAFTDQISLQTSTTVMTSNSSFEIPSTSITDDDCCEKLKENITLNTIHLEPLKFTHIDLHELKYAQHKLSEFDEQLQQELNKPFVINQSSWLQRILSIIFGIILLILLYNILKWCGFFQLFRRLFCCTKAPRAIEGSPCFQIFNKCCTTPVEQSIAVPVFYDAEQQHVNIIGISTSRPSNQEDASTRSSHSLRRSKRTQGIKINPY